MSFPDPLDRPARTIITSEGGQHQVDLSMSLNKIINYVDSHQ